MTVIHANDPTTKVLSYFYQQREDLKTLITERNNSSAVQRAIRADVSYRNAFFFRAESFYNVASEVDRLGPDLLKSYGGVSLHQQSHGESFMALFNHRLKSRGLYIFGPVPKSSSPLIRLSSSPTPMPTSWWWKTES